MTIESGPSAVERYLEALARQDWDALAACLTNDVERIGPYNDVYRGRGPYVAFLAETLRALVGYELKVSRVTAAQGVVVVELSETVAMPAGRRRRTDEAIIFDLSPDGLIHRVAVFLRRSSTT